MAFNLTTEELNAPAGMSTMDGGVATGRNPDLANLASTGGEFKFSSHLNTPPAAPAPATVPPGMAATSVGFETPEQTLGRSLAMTGGVPEPEPTIGEATGVDFRPGMQATYGDPAVEEYYRNLATSPVDEKSIQQRTLDMFQNEIDAVNTAYDQLFQETQTEGVGRLGSQRARAARGGILGSDFAGAQKSKVQKFNTEQEQAVQAERRAALGSIMSKARTMAQSEITRRDAARSQGADSWLAYLGNKETTRKENVQNLAKDFISQGVDPTEIEEQLDAIAQQYGASTDEVIAAYQDQLAAQTTEAEQFTLSKDQVRFDEDGNIIAEGPSGPRILKEGDVVVDDEGNVIQKIPKTFKPSVGGDESFGSFSNTDEQVLLGGGWSQNEISSLAEGVNQYGLQEVINAERVAGATEAQLEALQNVYGVDPDQDSPEFFSKDYFKSIYSMDKLEELAAEENFTEGGFLGIGVGRGAKGGVEKYLDSLMKQIEAYRLSGYTDKEIQKLMS